MTSQQQFTLELENKTLNFLDLGALRSDKKLDFNIHRKPTYTDTTVPHNPCHPTDHKCPDLKFVIKRLPHIN